MGYNMSVQAVENQHPHADAVVAKPHGVAHTPVEKASAQVEDRFESSEKSARQMPLSTEMVKFDSNQDGQLSAKDSSYDHLQVWKDRNHNGLREAGELQSLAQAGIQSLSAERMSQEHLVQAQLGTYAAPATEEPPKLNLEA